MRRLRHARHVDRGAGLSRQAGRYRLCCGGGECARDTGDAALSAALPFARFRPADRWCDARRHHP